ncbi:MAG: plasmid pRiA4b ORF-3 family protein [Bacteroidota bacterium]
MAYQLKVSLDYSSKPPIWRRILVPDLFSFHELHGVIQAAMGWQNAHLYGFRSGGRGGEEIGIPFDDDFMGGEVLDANKIPIQSRFTREKQKINYEYDFGDSWAHTVLIEKITDEKITAPRCLKGKGACPPEDCGGIYGYYEMVEAVNNPKHPEHDDMREWLGMEKGEKWDVNDFDLEESQQAVIHYQQFTMRW